MTLLFIVAIVLSLWVMYDSGELMSERTRLQTTADNVAYSTAALVARDLNFIAYTNRAMVANQVAIAQLVGISSWAASMEQLARNINTFGQFTPARFFTAGFGEGMTAAADAIDAAVEAMITVNDGMIQGLSSTQKAFHYALVPQLMQFGSDIGRRNDPDARSLMAAGDYSFAEAAAVVKEWNKRIGEQNELHEIDDDSSDAKLENRRFREFETVVQDSRDRFSKNRSYNWGFPFTATYEAFGGRVKSESRKYGASEFFRSTDPSDNKYRWDWAAMETVSQYVEFCIGPKQAEKCEELPEIPLTWGAAHALDESHNGATFFDYGFTSERRNKKLWGEGTWRNSASASLLLTSVNPNQVTGDHVQHEVGDINGLRDYYEFRSDEPLTTGPPIIALWVKDSGSLDSQRTLMQRSGGTVSDELDTEAHGGLLEQRIGAVAKAEPYFMRPTDLETWRRDDRHMEYGSLFNPYWQPRLIDLTNEEKIIAAAIVSNGSVAGEGS